MNSSAAGIGLGSSPAGRVPVVVVVMIVSCVSVSLMVPLSGPPPTARALLRDLPAHLFNMPRKSPAGRNAVPMDGDATR
jgi:hypothetical protein